MEDKPLLSVLMVVKNERSLVPAALESIQNQTFRSFEFIIIDDDSQDGTWDFLVERARTDPRIRLFKNEGKGLTQGLNMGLGLARTDWIARMDADDWSFPRRLEEQFKLTSLPGTVLVSADYVACDEDLREVATFRLADPNPRLLTYMRTRNNPLCHPLIVFHRQTALDCGGYSFRNAQDYDLWLKILVQGRHRHVPMPLLKYRIRRGSISISQFHSQRSDRNLIVKRPYLWLSSMATPDGMYAYRLAFSAWVAGKRWTFLKNGLKALRSRTRPLNILGLFLLSLLPRRLYLWLGGFSGVYR